MRTLLRSITAGFSAIRFNQKENSEIFDFELTAEEMQQLTSIDKKQRFADY